ncbi:MAG: hemerythrin domain-containing protein [Burkholderiales bacterium]|nr:hemerythrin domain-containing protein [Burkholderiales bacterium]
MKRSQELIALTREHHHALVLARRAIEAARDVAAARELAAALPRIFASELEPHFRVEEETLLPLLRDVGEDARVARTLDEHRQLRALAQEAGRGDRASLASFGLLLEAHVRFEERDLFARAEAILPSTALAAVAARVAAAPAPHP